MRLAIGLMLTLLVMPFLIRLAPVARLLDVPDARKHHAGPIPLVGGLAMFLVFVPLVALLPDPSTGSEHYVETLLVATSLFFLVGLVDDRGGLTVGSRFIVETAAALIMILFAGIKLTNLGDLLGFGDVMLGALALPFTLFAMVGVANAVNLTDGLDGLAGGLALVATAFLALVAYFSGMQVRLEMLLVLCGVLVGFLAYNMRTPWQARAKVFMGDSGSLMLGFVLAWFAIDLTQGDRSSLPPAAVLWFLAVPLWDTVSLMIRRVLQGRSPFHPGRDHLHHALQRAGFRDCQVVALILVFATLVGLIGLLGWRYAVPESFLFVGFLAAFGAYFFAVEHAWKLMRWVKQLAGQG